MKLWRLEILTRNRASKQAGRKYMQTSIVKIVFLYNLIFSLLFPVAFQTPWVWRAQIIITINRHIWLWKTTTYLLSATSPFTTDRKRDFVRPESTSMSRRTLAMATDCKLTLKTASIARLVISSALLKTSTGLPLKEEKGLDIRECDRVDYYLKNGTINAMTASSPLFSCSPIDAALPCVVYY